MTELRGIRCRGRSQLDIERRALQVRRAFGLADVVRINMFLLFEDLHEMRVPGAPDLSLGTRVFDNHQSGGIEALTTFRAGLLEVAVSTSTYEALESDDKRAPFTVAHELGHCELHVPELRQQARIPHSARALARRTAHHELYEDSEWQADTFGSAFLMPFLLVDDLLAQEATDGDIADAFGVSISAARVRVGVVMRRRANLRAQLRP